MTSIQLPVLPPENSQTNFIVWPLARPRMSPYALLRQFEAIIQNLHSESAQQSGTTRISR